MKAVSFFQASLFITLFTGVFFYLPTPVFASALIAHWKFDDGSGTAPVDSSGNGITAAFTTPNPTWSANVPSVSFSDPYSLDFTGNHDGVTVSWPSGLNFAATDPRTFSFWYKPVADGESDGTQARIISWTSDQFEISGTDGSNSTHKIAYYDGNWHTTSITLSLGTWYHVTFTYDGTTAKFYIGDTLEDSHALAGRALSGTLGIGTRVQTLNEGINGNIDDVRVYNYALTASQIANLTAGSSDPDSAPDSTAPTFSSIASSTASTSATVTWTTNEAASTKVVYSVDSTYASSTTQTDTSTRVTSHSKSVTDLLSCTTYNFKVVSADAAGNYATSTASSLTTTGCSGDATPSSSLSSRITVSGAATSTLTDSSRTLTVETPANFTNASTSVVIQIKGLSSDTVLGSIGKPSSSLRSAASLVFNVSALINNTTVVDSFDSPVTVSYTYTDADISGLTESTLSMYHYSSGSWSELNNCSVSASTNTITCTAPHFSVFAVFGSSSSSSSSTGGNGPIFTGSRSDLPGYVPPRMQTIYPDGRIVYWDERPVVPTIETSTKTSCPSYAFTRTLRLGMKGEDVRALQKLMNCLGFTLGKSGPGSPGAETNLFVDRTFDAVVRFQEAYVSAVLLPLHRTKGTGIFAELSQKKAQALMGTH